MPIHDKHQRCGCRGRLRTAQTRPALRPPPPVEEVEALAERIRVELILNKSIRRPGRRFYRDVLDYLDVVVDERHSEQGTNRESLRHTVMAYVRGMIEDKEPE
ncbi:MAG: hypothetical protein EXQ97_00470 [Alphaproteobacteria bacterium]|nr:hypothetical protein [Alphaproteobacteria bacterium]